MQIVASYSALFLFGAEEDLVQLLKEDDDIIKEGIVHVLANAGGIIREQLSKTSRSFIYKLSSDVCSCLL